MRRTLLALLALASLCLPAHATSTINPTTPTQGSTLTSAIVRNNFAAAYNDVNNILGKFASSTAPTNQTALQDWVDTSTSPTYVFKMWNPTTSAWVSWATLNVNTGVFSVISATGNFLADPPITVGVVAGVVTYGISLDSNFTTSGGSLALASIGNGHLLANCGGGAPAEPGNCTWSNFANQAISSTNGALPYRTGGVWSTVSTGVSGHTLPFLDAANTFSAAQTIYPGASALPAAISGTLLEAASVDGVNSRVVLTSTGASSIVTGRASLGTLATPLTLTSGTLIAAFNATGYDGTSWTTSTGNGAFRVYAEGTWTSTSHPTETCESTTPSGSLVIADVLCTHANGGVTIGPLPSQGAGTLNLTALYAGNAALTGGVVVGSATGGNKGAGTVNLSSAYYVNGRSSTSEVFYASNYGAVCDNATDDTAHIQAAITAAQVKGGIVQLPAGQCVLNSGLTASSAAGEIIIRGVGMGAGAGQVSNASNTQLLANFANGDVLSVVSDFGVVVEDLQFNSNVGARSSGTAIHIQAANPLTTANANSFVKNVSFSNQFTDIQCTNCAWPTITNTYHQAFVSKAILCDYAPGGAEAGCGRIENNYFFGNTTATCVYSHSGYTKISYNLFVACSYAVFFDIDTRAAGNPVVSFNTIENQTNGGIFMRNSGGIGAAMVQIVDNEFSTSNATKGTEIQILSNSGGVGPWIDGLQISRNIFRNSLTNGAGVYTIDVLSGTNVQIVGNQSDHLAGDTSNFILFGGATDLVAPVLVSNNTEQGSTTGARYVNPTAQVTIIDNIGLPFASMPALAANGSQIFTTNGAPSSNPLTGASTGAMGLRLNSAWLGQGVIAYGTGVAALLTGPASGTGGPAGTISPTFTGAPVLAAPSATTLIVGSLTTLATGDITAITGSATTLPISGSGSLLHLGAPSGGQSAITRDYFAAPATDVYRRANTSIGSPSALALNDIVMNVVSQGYGSTAYSGSRAYMRTISVEPTGWTDAVQGMTVTFGTTPIGGVATAEAGRFQDTGCLSVGTTTACAAGAILANTSIKATTSVTAVTAYNINTKLAWSATSPSVSSGFCTSPSISANNGTAAFTITIGSACAASTGVLTMPAASVGWACHFNNVTTPASNTPYQTASTTTSVSVTNYARTTGVASNWTASEVVTAECTAY